MVGVQFNVNGVLEYHDLQRKIFNGQMQLVKKSEVNRQWSKLLTSYQLRFLRFSLFVVYRRYNAITNTWYFERSKMSIPDKDYFEMTLRFLSDV